MATIKQIDSGFRQAGYSQGRPKQGQFPDALFPTDWERVGRLYSDEVINQMLFELGEDPAKEIESKTVGFEYLLGAKILEFVLTTGFAIDGRDLNLTSVNIGGINSSFDSAEDYYAGIRDRIKLLQTKARKLGAAVTPFLQLPTNTGGSGGGGLSSVETDDTIDGTGAAGDPLSVAEPYTAAERSKLAGLSNFTLGSAAVNTANIADEAVTTQKLDDVIVERLLPQPTDQASDAGRVAALSSDGSRYILVAQTGGGSTSAQGQADLTYTVITGPISFGGSYTNILTTPQTRDLPAVFYLEVTARAGQQDLYDVFPIRKSQLSADKSYEFGHSRNNSIDVRIFGNRLQIKETGSVSNAFVTVYKAQATRGLKGDEGQPGRDAVIPSKRLLPDPTDDAADSGKIAALNSTGTGYELVTNTGSVNKASVYNQTKDIIKAGSNVTITKNDTNNELTIAASGGTGGGSTTGADNFARARAAANAESITTLQDQCFDLATGEISTGWGLVRNVNQQGGIMVQSGSIPTLTQLKAATYSNDPTSPGGKYIGVRTPRDQGTRNFRVILTSGGPTTFTYTLQVSAMHVVGDDDKWQYSVENLPLGDHVAKVQMQLTGSTKHRGTSIFGGIFDGAIEDGVITAGALAKDSVISGNIAPNSIGTREIKSGVIPTNLKIAAGDVTLTSLANEVSRRLLPLTTAGDDDKVLTVGLNASNLAWRDIPRPKIPASRLTNGSIDTDKLNVNVVKRLLPATIGTKGQILQVNSAGTAVEYATPPDTSSGGGQGFDITAKLEFVNTINRTTPNEYDFVDGSKTTVNYSKPVFVSIWHLDESISTFFVPNNIKSRWSTQLKLKSIGTSGATVGIDVFKGTVSSVANSLKIAPTVRPGSYGGFTTSNKMIVTILH